MCVDAEVETGLCKDVLCISVIGHTTKNCRSPNDYDAVAIAFRHNPCTLSCYLFHHLIWPVQERKLKKHYCPWVIFASLLTKEQNVCAAMNKTARSLCSHSQSESPQKLFSEADWLVLALLQTPLYCPVIHTVTLKKNHSCKCEAPDRCWQWHPHLKAPMKSQGCTRWASQNKLYETKLCSNQHNFIFYSGGDSVVPKDIIHFRYKYFTVWTSD